MPLNLLQRLAQSPLPATVADAGEIDVVHILVLAGHVRARIPPPEHPPGGRPHQPPAQVTAITPLGWQSLALFTPLGAQARVRFWHRAQMSKNVRMADSGAGYDGPTRARPCPTGHPQNHARPTSWWSMTTSMS
jgi:hypothetical protein